MVCKQAKVLILLEIVRMADSNECSLAARESDRRASIRR